MALLLAALGMFVAFHFMAPYTQSDPGFIDAGWKIWQSFFDLLREPSEISPYNGIVASSFLTLALLIVTTPFLFYVWLRSGYAWCFVTILSGLAAAGFTGLEWIRVLDETMTGSYLLGGWFLMFSPILNFLGLLLARRWRDASRNPLPETNPPRQSI